MDRDNYFLSGTLAGALVGFLIGISYMSYKVLPYERKYVVIYCNEKPELCKTEYTHYKKHIELENFKLPEIK